MNLQFLTINIISKEVGGICKMELNSNVRFENTEQEPDIMYERCIVCHRLTNVPIHMRIEERTNYVEGAGQLCEQCFYRFFKDHR